jgi:hypothetical protein
MNIFKVSIVSITAVILFQATPVKAQDVNSLIDRLCMDKGLSASTEAICADAVINMARDGASVDVIIYETRSLIRYTRASEEQSRRSADTFRATMNRR